LYRRATAHARMLVDEPRCVLMMKDFAADADARWVR
jgi:hypothetical protein